MTKDPICSTEQDESFLALDPMQTNQIRRLPVVNEKHQVVGMLWFGDLLRKSDIEANALVAALQSICDSAQVPKQATRGIVTAA